VEGQRPEVGAGAKADARLAFSVEARQEIIEERVIAVVAVDQIGATSPRMLIARARRWLCLSSVPNLGVEAIPEAGRCNRPFGSGLRDQTRAHRA